MGIKLVNTDESTFPHPLLELNRKQTWSWSRIDGIAVNSISSAKLASLQSVGEFRGVFYFFKTKTTPLDVQLVTRFASILLTTSKLFHKNVAL